MAAYDETHKDSNGSVMYWVFLNSWQGGGIEIHWMTNDDLKNTNGSFSIWDTVIISKP